MGLFDKIIDRRDTNSIKWDSCQRVFGSDDLLPMWVADSDWKAPQVVIEAIRDRVNHGVFGYTEPGEELNKAVVKWVKERYGWHIEAEWLVYTSGVVPAINITLQTMTGPGGNVVIQPPVYYPFFSAVKKSGANLIENQLVLEGNQYKIDFEDLEEKLAEVSKLKKEMGNRDNSVCEDDIKDTNQENSNNILILCSPHNPVGRVWSKEELNRLGELCLKYNFLVISDEIHADLVYTGYNHIPIASISDRITQNTITMIAPSKTFNLAGLGAAVTIIPDKKMRESFVKTMRGLVPSGNVIGYTAMEATYSKGEEWLEGQLKYLKENRNYLIQFIGKYIPGIKVIKPEGTYLVWLDCRGLEFSNKDLERFMIEKAKVGLNAGTWFGSGGEGFMRLNIACPRSVLKEGLTRIKDAVQTFK